MYCSEVLCYAQGLLVTGGFWATSASHWLVTPAGPLLPPGTFTLKQPNRENTELFKHHHIAFVIKHLCRHILEEIFLIHVLSHTNFKYSVYCSDRLTVIVLHLKFSSNCQLVLDLTLWYG